MSMLRKCDICGKDIILGVGDKARGLIWGKYNPPGPGQKPLVIYIGDKKDIKFDDVCEDCMEKIMEKVEEIKNTLEIKRPRVSYKKSR